MVRLYRVLQSLVFELHWRRVDVGGRATPLEEKVKMVVESREKFLGWVTRGEESDVGVGVTLEVGLHRFKKCCNCGRDVGKNVGVGKGRRGMRI